MTDEIRLSSDDFQLISNSLVSKMMDLESVYRRSVNSNPSYATKIADIIARYNDIYKRISGVEFITQSESLARYLYSLKMECV